MPTPPEHIADLSIEGFFFTRERWTQLTHLFNLMPPHMQSCSRFFRLFSSMQKDDKVQKDDRTYHRKRYSQTKTSAQSLHVRSSCSKFVLKLKCEHLVQSSREGS